MRSPLATPQPGPDALSDLRPDMLPDVHGGVSSNAPIDVSIGVPIDAYISLGSNLGDPERNLALALEGLKDLARTLPGVIGLGACSPVYVTEPQGLKDQPFFRNQAALVHCAASLRPLLLLEALLGMEASLGRVRRGAKRHGPRVVDLDLLLFGNARMNSSRLTLPHPRMLERAFVLVPLGAIAPELVLPGGLTPGQALERLPHSCRDGVILQA